MPSEVCDYQLVVALNCGRTGKTEAWDLTKL
jgi:hypothetical protein